MKKNYSQLTSRMLPSFLQRIASFLFIFGILLTLLGTAGCKVETDNAINVEKVKEEINDRKIKRYTDAQIVQAAFEMGKSIADSLGEDLLAGAVCGQSLKERLSDTWQKQAADAVSVICTLATNWQEKEKLVWEAYAYNQENGLPLQENIQRIDPEFFVFTHPLAADTTVTFRVLRIQLSSKEVIRSLVQQKK
jgi:hypothetical protein